MVKERLLSWAAAHKDNLPKSILFYRDGVSESQYAEVVMKELPQVYDGFKYAHADLKKKGAVTLPKVTFVVVTKRHHARFYPASNAGVNFPNCKDTDKSLRAGQLFDTHVVTPHRFDFYLQSHGSPLGTAKGGSLSGVVRRLRLLTQGFVRDCKLPSSDSFHD